jgi:hypothetical protein
MTDSLEDRYRKITRPDNSTREEELHLPVVVQQQLRGKADG